MHETFALILFFLKDVYLFDNQKNNKKPFAK